MDLVILAVMTALLQVGTVFAVERDAVDITCASQKTYREEEKKCCNNECCDSCKPGHFVIETCRKGVKAMCGECPPGTFSSGSYGSIRCTKCGQCDNTAHTTLKNCSTSSDTVCPCGVGMFMTAHLKCKLCGKCPPGSGVLSECGGFRNTVCGKCKEGFFSNETSLQKCQKCVSCPQGSKVSRTCTDKQNTLCEDVTEGTGSIPTKTFIQIVAAVGAIAFAFFVLCLVFLIQLWRRRRTPPVQPLLGAETASEPQCRGSSVSSLDQEKRVMKYIQGLDGQSFSTRSSLCSDKPKLMNPNVRLNKLGSLLIQKLSFHLNPANSYYKDWEGLAALLEYTQLEIKNFKLSEGKRYTEAMLEDFCTRKPKLATLGFLFEKILELDRDDVVEIIIEFDRKLSSDRTETPV